MKCYTIPKKYIYNNYCIFDDTQLNFEVVVVKILRSQIWFMTSTIFHISWCVYISFSESCYSIDLIEVVLDLMKRLDEVITVISVGEILYYKCILV